jgi:uncharacterized protein (TIGR02466 family)
MGIYQMNGHLHHLFPTLIHRIIETQPDHDLFIDKATQLKQTLSPDSNWQCSTFNTLNKYDMINDPLFKNLIAYITDQVSQFAVEFGCSPDSAVITDSWINVAEPGDYQEYHIHTGNHFSIVYYITAPKDSGNIVFRCFEADTDMFPLPVKAMNYTSYKTFSFPPEAGQLLIFRSNLRHMVEKNMSSDPRISISMNFKIT